ncbi:hypothetical protein [Streptomyces sp. NPDC059783]|uniref:hypothetical protein n=1 Tax=Streptomyces sp. NPDC059783 TaxID=3346944 RepID=UPI00364A3C56
MTAHHATTAAGPGPITAADIRLRVERDMKHALDLPPAQQNCFLAHYPDTINRLTAHFPAPDSAYTVFADYADDIYERLVEDAEHA